MVTGCSTPLVFNDTAWAYYNNHWEKFQVMDSKGVPCGNPPRKDGRTGWAETAQLYCNECAKRHGVIW